MARLQAMKTASEIFDLLDRDGQRHSFSKVTSFGAQLLVGTIVSVVLVRGGHFIAWDCAALGILVLTPHGYGLATKYMRWRWERPTMPSIQP